MLVMLEYLGKIVALAIALVALREQQAVDPRWIGVGVGDRGHGVLGRVGDRLTSRSLRSSWIRLDRLP